MAATIANVKVIYPETTRTDPDIQFFLDTAALIIDEQLLNSGLSVTRKDRIHAYLTAHFLVVSEETGGLKSEKLGDSSASYQAPSASFKGLETTRFGQQAIALDTSGTLNRYQLNSGVQGVIDVIDERKADYGI
jgi:hypothetical protein